MVIRTGQGYEEQLKWQGDSQKCNLWNCYSENLVATS